MIVASYSTRQFSRRWMIGILRQQPHRHYSLSRCNANISRMLDMGGAPGGATAKNNVRPRNTSKNSKVQAVAFDFELLVKTIHEQAEDVDNKKPKDSTSTGSLLSASKVQPNLDQLQEVASLLKVDLDDPSDSRAIGKRNESREDDLSGLLGNDTKEPPKEAKKLPTSTSPLEPDIRAKYARQLHRKGVDGGVAGVELVQHQREEALKRGDAEGHWAARKIAASVGTTGTTRWMALTGTGKLLSTLTHRSLKIALLPRPIQNSTAVPQDRSPAERMQDLTRQLKDVIFDVVVDLPSSEDDSTNTKEAAMVKTVLEKLDLDPKFVLFVSDQDAFLKPAKELGLMTCRVRPLNARRGNITAHHTVETVLQVHDVVNEMNGISFNAVLNM